MQTVTAGSLCIIPLELNSMRPGDERGRRTRSQEVSGYTPSTTKIAPRLELVHEEANANVTELDNLSSADMQKGRQSRSDGKERGGEREIQ